MRVLRRGTTQKHTLDGTVAGTPKRKLGSLNLPGDLKRIRLAPILPKQNLLNGNHMIE